MIGYVLIGVLIGWLFGLVTAWVVFIILDSAQRKPAGGYMDVV